MRVDAVSLERGGLAGRCVLGGVDSVVDDLDALGADVEKAQHVLAGVTGHRDHRIGHLESRALDPGRDVVPTTQLLALPGAKGFKRVDGDDEGAAVGQSGQDSGQMRVPGVAVHDVGADWVSHEADVAAERRPQALQHRVGGVDGVRGLIRANPPAILVRRRSGEAAHLDLDELAQLAGQVVDVDPSAAVHVGRELIGEDQGPHRRLA